MEGIEYIVLVNHSFEVEVCTTNIGSNTIVCRVPTCGPVFMDQALHGYGVEEEGLIYTDPIGLC